MTINKKNKATRFASLMLVLTLISTTALCGVLAKYVITDNSNDSARVAKFGVVTTVEGSLFNNSYAAVADGNSAQSWAVNKATVSAGASDVEVVAPGTKNEKGLLISVTGTPEVSTKLTVDTPEDGSGKHYANSDIYLKEGAYSLMAEMQGSDVEITTDNMADYYTLNGQNFEQLSAVPAASATIYKRIALTGASTGAATAGAKNMSGDYYPIDWYLSNDGTAANSGNAYNGASAQSTLLSDLISGLGASGSVYAPNTNLGNSVGNAKITWEWPFGGSTWDASSTTNWENTTLRDLEDTALGEMIARKNGETGYEIAVAGSGSSLVKVNYATIDKIAGSSANQIEVAYTGTTAPTSADMSKVVACLTAAFGVRVTVEQVD